MWSILLKALGWLVGRLFGQQAPQSPEARASAQAASAQTSLTTEQQTNVQVAKAVEAARASDDRISRDPDSLRAPDPDSRD